MDLFLATTLKYMNKMEPSDLADLEQKFQRSMTNNYIVFKQHAFRKHTSLDQHRSVLNASLFDVFSVMMAQYDTDFIQTKVDIIQNLFFELMQNEKFFRAITSGTNDTIRVRDRFTIAEQAFQEL